MFSRCGAREACFLGAVPGRSVFFQCGPREACFFSVAPGRRVFSVQREGDAFFQYSTGNRNLKTLYLYTLSVSVPLK